MGMLCVREIRILSFEELQMADWLFMDTSTQPAAFSIKTHTCNFGISIMAERSYNSLCALKEGIQIIKLRPVMAWR
jgi:hypothetical protein